MTNDQGQPLPPDSSVRSDRLLTAVRLADVIRRVEGELIRATSSTTPSSSTSAAPSTTADPLKPLRTCLETPGVKEGVSTAALCLVILIPGRQWLLRTADRHWQLGTIFPDLIVTPTCAVIVAQCSLWSTSVFGSATYLNRLADIASPPPTNNQSLEQKQQQHPLAHLLPHSPTVDSICNDPVMVEAMKSRPNKAACHDNSSSSSMNNFDPREQTLLALDRALTACQVRLKAQELVSNAAGAVQSDRAHSGNKLFSWWR